LHNTGDGDHAGFVVRPPPFNWVSERDRYWARTRMACSAMAASLPAPPPSLLLLLLLVLLLAELLLRVVPVPVPVPMLQPAASLFRKAAAVTAGTTALNSCDGRVVRVCVQV
jgi:hypothetical protein